MEDGDIREEKGVLDKLEIERKGVVVRGRPGTARSLAEERIKVFSQRL